MALTQTRREELAATIAEDGNFNEETLLSLTDNQLVGLADAESLDNLVTLAANASDKGKTLNEYSDDDLESEMAMRKKKGKKPTMNAASDDEDDEDEYLAKAPKSIQRLVANALAAETKQKAAAIQKITANKACEWTPEELDGMDVSQLEKMARMASATVPTASYAGRGGFQTTSNASHVEEPLVAPELDFSN